MTDDQLRDTVAPLINALTCRHRTVAGSVYTPADIVTLLHALRDFLDLLAHLAQPDEVQP